MKSQRTLSRTVSTEGSRASAPEEDFYESDWDNTTLAGFIAHLSQTFPEGSRGDFLITLIGEQSLYGALLGAFSPEEFINYAVSNEIMSRQDQVDLYRMSDPITRAEAVAFRARQLGIAPLEVQTIRQTFADLPISHPLAGIVYAAVQDGRIEGYSREAFGPDDVLAEGSFGKVISRMTSPGTVRFHPLSGATVVGERDPLASEADRVEQLNKAIDDDEIDANTHNLPEDLNGYAGIDGKWNDKDLDGVIDRGETDVTHCNTYATDLAKKAGVFLPHFWWKDATVALAQAQSRGRRGSIPSSPQTRLAIGSMTTVIITGGDAWVRHQVKFSRRRKRRQTKGAWCS